MPSDEQSDKRTHPSKPTPEEWIKANERIEELTGSPVVPNYRDPVVLWNLTTYDKRPEIRLTPEAMGHQINQLRKDLEAEYDE